MTNEDRISHHIVSVFDKRTLGSLTRDDLQGFLDSLSGLSFSTVDHLRWDLKQILDMAVAEGLVPKNPAVLLFTPRECTLPEHRAMTLKEVQEALAVLDLRERLILKLAILAGMRPGEIFGLKRGHLTAGCAAVQCRVYRGDVDTPKTAKSKRQVALSESVRADLQLWLKNSPGGAESWLFPSEKLSTPLAKDNAMYRYIRPRLSKIGLGWVDFHAMRRTHSSLMREMGVDPKVVADQQGHTLDVNLNVYTSTSLATKIEAVEKLNSALIH
jgi:integrase